MKWIKRIALAVVLLVAVAAPDYPIFHMDIRENAKLRVATFLAQ